MKVVPDTNVLIGLFRDPIRKAAFDLQVHRSLMFMNSVVAMELQAGCRTPRHRRAMAGFLKPFERTGRVISPDYVAYLEAGRVLALLADEGVGREHLRQLLADVLIAISSSRAGAVVVTANAKDFSRIENHTPVRWILTE